MGGLECQVTQDWTDATEESCSELNGPPTPKRYIHTLTPRTCESTLAGKGVLHM